jgi:hypothetical protein
MKRLWLVRLGKSDEWVGDFISLQVCCDGMWPSAQTR